MDKETKALVSDLVGLLVSAHAELIKKDLKAALGTAPEVLVCLWYPKDETLLGIAGTSEVKAAAIPMLLHKTAAKLIEGGWGSEIFRSPTHEAPEGKQ